MTNMLYLQNNNKERTKIYFKKIFFILGKLLKSQCYI